MIKIGIVGSRNFLNLEKVDAYLNNLHQMIPSMSIITYFVINYCKARNIDIIIIREQK